MAESLAKSLGYIRTGEETVLSSAPKPLSDLDVTVRRVPVRTMVVLWQSEISVVPIYEGMPHYTDALLRYERARYELLDLFVVNRTRSGAVLENDELMSHARAAG